MNYPGVKKTKDGWTCIGVIMASPDIGTVEILMPSCRTEEDALCIMEGIIAVDRPLRAVVNGKKGQRLFGTLVLQNAAYSGETFDLEEESVEFLMLED